MKLAAGPSTLQIDGQAANTKAPRMLQQVRALSVNRLGMHAKLTAETADLKKHWKAYFCTPLFRWRCPSWSQTPAIPGWMPGLRLPPIFMNRTDVPTDANKQPSFVPSEGLLLSQEAAPPPQGLGLLG